jgi:YD repeat-containing protein
MKNTVFLLLLSLCIIPACKKSALPVAGGNTLNKTVQAISGTSTLSVDSFVYDGQQRLAEIICSGIDDLGNPIADTITFQYDASGRVLSWILIGGGVGREVSYELSYDGNGRLVNELAVPQQTDLACSDYSFAYDARGQLVTDTIYAQHLAGIPSAGIMSYDNWTYDETGNAIADQLFTGSNPDLVGPPFTAGVPSTYRYDNQVNPYYHAGIPFFCSAAFEGVQLLSPNNLVGGTASGASVQSPYTFSYAYYSNGRPREQTTAVYGATGPVTQTIRYFYQ